MQFISVGNIATQNKVAIILMDYTGKARLKIYAKAEIVEIEDHPELFNQPNPAEYKFRPDRIMVSHIDVYDWNCLQYITPRFYLEEIQNAISPKMK
jgi:hypothetical protein